MNDKDKEAFEKWWMEGFKGMSQKDVIKYRDVGKQSSFNGWQAACEHKQKEVDEIKNVTYWAVEQDGKVTRHISISEIEKLQAENAKLRECVEFYSVNGLSNATVGTKIDTKLTHQFYINGEYARQVLKKLDEK